MEHGEHNKHDPTLSDRALDQRYWISNWPGIYFLFCMFQSESFHFDDFTSPLCSCPVLWKYIPHFHFCVRVQSPCLGVLTFLSVSVFSWLSGVRGRECLVTREIASRNIWQYLNNNKASANLNMKSLFSLSVSGHVPLISEIVSEKSGASCFYLSDRTGVDSEGKEAKIDFSC